MVGPPRSIFLKNVKALTYSHQSTDVESGKEGREIDTLSCLRECPRWEWMLCSRKVLSSWARAEGQAGPGKVSLNSHENSVPVDFILYKAVGTTCAGTHQ